MPAASFTLSDSTGKSIETEPGNVRSQKSKAKACKPHRTHICASSPTRPRVCICVCTWRSVAEIMKLLTLEQLPAKKQKRCSTATSTAAAAKQKKRLLQDKNEGGGGRRGKNLRNTLNERRRHVNGRKETRRFEQKGIREEGRKTRHAAIIIAVQTWLWFATENRKASEKPKRRKMRKKGNANVCVCECESVYMCVRRHTQYKNASPISCQATDCKF